MAQVKVYARKGEFRANKALISDSIHDAVMGALSYPQSKRFHRFFELDSSDFFYPSDRSERYTIIEISIFKGRTVQAKKALIRRLYQNFQSNLGLAPNDLEITIFETPRQNWGIRGLPGDELSLSYDVNV